jgi:hypothetical protein
MKRKAFFFVAGAALGLVSCAPVPPYYGPNPYMSPPPMQNYGERSGWPSFSSSVGAVPPSGSYYPPTQRPVQTTPDYREPPPQSYGAAPTPLMPPGYEHP